MRGSERTVVIGETGVNRAVLLLRLGKGDLCNVSSFPKSPWRSPTSKFVKLGR